MKRSFSVLLSVIMFVFCFGFVSETKNVSAEASETEAKYCATFSPNGGSLYETVVETISYAYREVDEYYNPYKLPAYFSPIQNTCAVTSGGVVMGYYDRIYENLIPDFAGRTFAGKYYYSAQNEKVNNMFQELYVLMDTDDGGTTVVGYKNGLNAYTQQQGYSISFNNAMNGSGPDYAACKAALQNGKLLSLFFNGFELIDINSGIVSNNGEDTIRVHIYNGRHSMVAYGYKIIRYFDSSDNQIDENIYFYVASGVSNCPLTLLRMDGVAEIDNMYITEVY